MDALVQLGVEEAWGVVGGWLNALTGGTGGDIGADRSG